jgi:hypothetical protein
MTTSAAWNVGGVSGIGKLQIMSNGKLTASFAVTLTAVTTFQLDSGATYVHTTGSIGTTIMAGIESFAIDSNFVIQTAAAPIFGGGFPTGGFGNLTLKSSANVAINGNIGMVNGNMTYSANGVAVTYTLISNSSSKTLTIGGNLIIDDALVTVVSASSTGRNTINVAGDVLVQSGALRLASASTGGTELNISGNLQIGNLSTSNAGSLHSFAPLANPTINFKGINKSFDLINGGLFTAANINIVVKTGASLNVGSTNLTLTTSTSALPLTIEINGLLTVTDKTLTTAGGIINNGTLNIKNNANLIQSTTTVNTGTGVTNINRNSSPLLRLDYTLWSSPVASQNLLAFSPKTITTRFYNFNTTYNVSSLSGAYSAILDPTTTNFTNGKGYLIRMPNDAEAVTPTPYQGVFTGVANNGDIQVALVDGGVAGLRYNLVGNPYPSPITMSTFVADNSANIESTLYFWRKTNGLGTAYCTWNGGTFVTNINAQSEDPLGIIQIGQGFFVEAKSAASSISFNNLQRVADNSGQFFKTKQVAESSRIWLNATNAAGIFSQMAVSYTTNATQGVDAFDGKYINDSTTALTSNINNDEYTIQGRSLPFDPSDLVALNFKTDVAGEYSIALDHFDGVFAKGHDVYLVDGKTGTETNLKSTAYTFTATTGTDNTRFLLKYQKTLKIDALAFNENSVRIYKSNGTIYINSGDVAISNIKVFDIQGRLIADQQNVKSNTASISNLKSNQALIVQVISEDNKVVSKKVVN